MTQRIDFGKDHKPLVPEHFWRYHYGHKPANYPVPVTSADAFTASQWYQRIADEFELLDAMQRDTYS